MEFHKLCLLFPKADDKTLYDMASSIVEHGQLEPIITFEGKILDGRNRFLACEIANVKPGFEEYDKNKYGNNPFQYVVNKNLHRRHLNESQRAALAQEVYAMAKSGELPKVTMEDISKQFKVSERTIRDAGTVKENASEAVQKAVVDGSVRVGKAADAIKQAVKNVGVTGLKTATPEEKKKVREEADRIIRNEAPPPKPSNHDRDFQERVKSGEFNGKRWKKNVDEIQMTISLIEKLPNIYNDCFDLLKTLDHEILLSSLVTVFRSAIQRTEVRLQSDEAVDVEELRKIVADITVNKFQIPETLDDSGTTDKKELLGHLREKFIADCQACLKTTDAICVKMIRKAR
jgi:hypothetical protein